MKLEIFPSGNIWHSHRARDPPVFLNYHTVDYQLFKRFTSHKSEPYTSLIIRESYKLKLFIHFLFNSFHKPYIKYNITN